MGDCPVLGVMTPQDREFYRIDRRRRQFFRLKEMGPARKAVPFDFGVMTVS